LVGDAARGMFTVPALTSLADGWNLAFDDFRKIGDDLRITARVSRVASA
jgi:diaminohydroxyphosphoribosylaminopyrimidine deaminase/5-amino-6-(5-phosphoribosylamino)uracil reductase